MDAHPVPQNVTSFEFRLVGDMTLKQFLYLAAGVGLAYLLFVTIAAKFPIVAWPLIVIFSLLGVAYAFVPIQDRPLDHWTAAFFRAIYAPTKRAWRKNGKNQINDIVFKNRLNVYLSAATAPAKPPLLVQAFPPPTPQPVKIPPAPALHPINLAPIPKSIIHTQVAPPQIPIRPTSPLPPPAASVNIPTLATKQEPLPTPKELSQTVELGKQAQTLQLRIIETEKQLNEVKKRASGSREDLESITPQFNQIFENLQKLTQEASAVKQQLATLTKQPTIHVEPIKVEIVAPSKPRLTQIILTSLPNVINGIITDAAGNYLDAAVVVIHDKDGLPVRALKTNKLGQFTGSTPLLNGAYTVELEKDGFVFDVLKIELEGKVLPPLMIAAKVKAAQS